jgi:signal transduction histidine kinase
LDTTIGLSGRRSATDVAGGTAAELESPGDTPGVSLHALPAAARDRRTALALVLLSLAVFAAIAPFAKQPLTPVWAFVPIYQAALVIIDAITAAVLLSQFRILGGRPLLLLGCAYLFTAAMTVAHTLSFPGLFATGGLLGAGPQSTAWLYMFWHAGFPALVSAYAVSRESPPALEGGRGTLAAIVAVLAVAIGLTLLATAGKDLLPAIMQGNRYSPAMSAVVTSVWVLSGLALVLLWRRRPQSVLDVWLMVVMCAWMIDVALAAVLNGGRFDLGFYAGRVYGLLAASFVLIVLLAQGNRLVARLAGARRIEGRWRKAELSRTREVLAEHVERLRIVRDIERAVLAEEPTEAIAEAAVVPLRELLGVPRVIVNRFYLEAGEVEWIAAAGRRRTHVGPGVRYSIRLMGDVDALRRGETQLIDTGALPSGADVDALRASGVHHYMVVPMIAGGELLGALSFGGESPEFPAEQVSIAEEVAAQLAIAMAQAMLLERVRAQAAELEQRVRERTAQLEEANRELQAFSYSVSHDLRAPLRAVDGYARMLEEDFGPKLDDEGRRLLGVVRASSVRMGQLIDDLLAFSQLGRRSLASRAIDMTELAREAADEAARDSKAAIELRSLPAATADASLLKQVWLNLIANAVKYSAKSERPVIEIAGRGEAAENIYWVRDNGAGFDMRYASKLFGVFQRLHRAEEYPGTGVGLAIVQRVVTRHGGRVWAEGRPGEGACFYFSLPRSAG